jgi:hypothetical protein
MRLTILALASGLLLSCAKTIIPHPAIPTADVTRTQLQVPNSFIDIPISLPVSVLGLDQKIQGSFNSPNWPGITRIKTNGDQNDEFLEYQFQINRSPLAVSCTGNTFTVESTLTFNALKGHGCVKMLGIFGCAPACGFDLDCPGVSAKISFESTITLESDYTLKGVTKIKDLNSTGAKCRVGHILLAAFDDMSAFALAMLKEKFGDQICSTIDQEIDKISVKSLAELGWDRLSQEFAVDDQYTFRLYPSKVRFGGINGIGNVINFTIGVEATPQITNSISPYTPNPIPSLENGFSGNVFHIFTDFKSDYEALSLVIKQSLGNKPLVFKKNSTAKDSVTLEIRDCKVQGLKNGQVGFCLRGKAKAGDLRIRKCVIYLYGTPVFNAITQELTFPDIDYEINTYNLFLNFLIDLKQSSIKEILVQSAKGDLNPQFQRTKQKIESLLNRDFEGTHISTNIIGIGGQDIVVDPLELTFRTFLIGSISVSVKD